MAGLTFESGMKLLVSNDARALYSRSVEALRKNEKNPLAFFFLGMLATNMGEAAKALELYGKAAEHGPAVVRYNAYYAKALLSSGRMGEALSYADKAVSVGTRDAFLADMVGTVYSRAGRHDQALPLFEKAVRINPKWAPFQFNLAASSQFLGQFDRAKKAYQNTIDIDPRFNQAWYALTQLEPQTSEANYLEHLIPLFEAAIGNADGQLLLGHAIAKTYEDLGQYENSFEWLEKAKALKRKNIDYKNLEQSRVFQAAKVQPRAAPMEASEAAPIFIVGLPRTGTTLTDRILSSHKQVTSLGELNIFPELLVRNMEGTTNPFAASSNALAKTGNDFAAYVNSLAPDAEYVIDKTPMNFLYAGLISRALPNAKIIAVRRGAMDTCLSNYRHLFAAGKREFDYSCDIENTASYYRDFDDLMACWREVLPENSFTEVHYEEIVRDQENQTRRLLEFCGLGWDAACLRFHENTAAVDSASSVQVRQPLNADSVDRWKKYGNKLNGLKSALGDLAQS